MQALQVFWQGINSEGQPCEGILTEVGGLEQIRQQLHHQGFFQLQINTVEPAQLQKPLRVAWLAEMTGQWKQLADSGLPLKDCLRFLIRTQKAEPHLHPSTVSNLCPVAWFSSHHD